MKYEICSTNGLNPKCKRYYYNSNNSSVFQPKSNNLIVSNTTSVNGYFPIKNNINYLYTFINNKLYTVYSTDNSNSYYSSTINQNFMQISTNIDDRNWLNSINNISLHYYNLLNFVCFSEADFINTFNYDSQYIYFVFNENQQNYETQGDVIRNRVGL